MKVIKELKTKSGNFVLSKYEPGDWILGSGVEESKQINYMVIAEPMALLISELFDLIESQQE